MANSFVPDSKMTVSVPVTVVQEYAVDGLDIIEFSVSSLARVCAFTVRYNRADGVEQTTSYTITGDDFDAYVMGNVSAIQGVRAGVWAYLEAAGIISGGVDYWPGE